MNYKNTEAETKWEVQQRNRKHQTNSNPGSEKYSDWIGEPTRDLRQQTWWTKERTSELGDRSLKSIQSEKEIKQKYEKE